MQKNVIIQLGNVNKSRVKTNLTERVKSPGLLLLGRARKLPWTPRVNKSCSASIPVTLGWNHLKSSDKTTACYRGSFESV